MPASKKYFRFIIHALLLSFLLGQPAFSETAVTETSLPVDVPAIEEYQAGSGLPVGKILSLRGEVLVYHRDQQAACRLKAGRPLYLGDTIHTQAAGRISGRLIGGTTFSLAPDTTIEIVQCNYNLIAQSGSSFISLKDGTGRFQVKAPADARSHEVRIETRTVLARTHDADFIVRAQGDTTTFVTFARSRLEVTHPAAVEEIFLLSDFQKTVVTQEQHPQTISGLTEAESASWAAETRLLPEGRLFASSPERYSEQTTTDKTSDSINDAQK